jgi:hypothetical protein
VTVGSLKQEDHVPGCLGKKQDPISKITRERRAGGMVQVVEHLPMSSNLSADTSSASNSTCDTRPRHFTLIRLSFLVHKMGKHWLYLKEMLSGHWTGKHAEDF